MTTVDRAAARKVARGDYPEDRFTSIVAYRNRWGGPSYKLLREGQVLHPSEYVFDPHVVWKAGDTLQAFTIASTMWEERHLAPEYRSPR